MSVSLPIPFYDLNRVHYPLKQDFMQVASEVLDNNAYVLSSYLHQFETEFASFCSTAYAIGVGNGYDALFLSLKALGIGPGDEVLVPAHTFIATWMAVSATGARPVPVDANKASWNIDLNRVEEKWSSKTKLIVPVHMYGLMCDMEGLDSLARQKGIGVMEDYSQAQGARCRGKMAGSWGQVNAASLYPGKNLGALGDAGIVTTQSPDIAKAIYRLRNYGSDQKYHHEEWGVNSRMDGLQAGILSVKLKHLVEWNTERKILAAQYQQGLEGIQEVQFQQVDDWQESVYHQMVILVPDRDHLQHFLVEKGIQTGIHYPIPIHLQPAYSGMGWKAGDFPVSEYIARHCLSLPMYPGLSKEEVAYVCESIISYFKK